MMKKDFLFLNGFFLKIIAFILMTFDHIGIFMVISPDPSVAMIGNVFRLIGRFAFPLFVLMLVEGVRHTHSYAKYALRMGIVASAIMLVQIIAFIYFDNALGDAYSPLLDLLCYGTILYLLSRKDKFSFLAIIPFGLVILSFIVGIIEMQNNINIFWFPVFVRSGYSIFGLIIALIMYYAYPFLKKFFTMYNMDIEGYEENTSFRFSLNVLYSFAVIIAVITIYLIARIPNADLFMVNESFYSETWALGSIVFILFYSGKRGYNAKWFQYASYLYFPLHLVIIYFVFYIINSL